MKRLAHSNPRAQSEDAGSIPAVASKYDMFYCNGKPVEIVSRPRSHRQNVVYVRDIESGMCFLAKSYQLIYKPASR